MIGPPFLNTIKLYLTTESTEAMKRAANKDVILVYFTFDFQYSIFASVDCDIEEMSCKDPTTTCIGVEVQSLMGLAFTL